MEARQEPPETPGERAHRLRRRKNLGVEEMAARIGTSPSALSRFERDQRDLPSGVVKNLAKELGITPNDLLGYPEGDTGMILSGNPPQAA